MGSQFFSPKAAILELWKSSPRVLGKNSISRKYKMSAPTIAKPGSVSTKESNSQSEPRVQQSDIANLAYALWQQRGSLHGSSEQDWTEAEATLQDEKASQVSARR
jgi:hypothetical protein